MQMRDLREPTDIEALLVWTYRKQRADRVLAADAGLFDQEATIDGGQRSATSRDGVAAMARIGALGVRVNGAAASAGALHVDAEVVHDAVTSLPPIEAALVIAHARAGTRPDDSEIVPPRAGPRRNERGRIIRCYAEWDESRRYGWTPIGWTVEPTTADAVRVEYELWRRALDTLAFALATDGRLTRHRPTPPLALAVASLRYTPVRTQPREAVPSPDMLLA
jgi:hypothetical protein